MDTTEPMAIGAASLIGGRYRLGELIGRGATAEVFRARDEVLARPVAVKVYHTESLSDFTAARQRAEVEILASLNHPALVAVFDAGSDNSVRADPRTYVVMELIDGLTLAHAISRGPMHPDDVATIGAQICAALEYVHSRGIIHRDVKPANVVLATGGERVSAKLTDFGIARHVDGTRMTSVGSTIGTAGYLSPEQAMGGELSGASDMYALGLVLLEALTGRRAFPGHGVEAAVLRLHADPVVPDRLGPEWGHLLTALTSRNPAERPDPVQARRALLALLPDVADDTEPLGPARGLTWLPADGEQAIEPGRRRFVARALVGGLAIAAAVLAVTLAFAGDRTPQLAAPSVSSGSAGAAAGSVTSPASSAMPEPAGTSSAVPLPVAVAVTVASTPTLTRAAPPAPGNKPKPTKSKGKGKP